MISQQVICSLSISIYPSSRLLRCKKTCLKFLRNREIIEVSYKKGSKESAVFTTAIFQAELNKALQRRNNRWRERDHKKAKLAAKFQNFGIEGQGYVTGGAGAAKRHLWGCRRFMVVNKASNQIIVQCCTQKLCKRRNSA